MIGFCAFQDVKMLKTPAKMYQKETLHLIYIGVQNYSYSHGFH